MGREQDSNVDVTLSDAAIPSVSKAFEETQGITNLKVEVIEGIATVEVRMKIPILGLVTNCKIYVAALLHSSSNLLSHDHR
ncbi:hypothetical protein ACFX1T_044905 [Malus domestica]